MPTRPPIHDSGFRRAQDRARGSAAARGYDGRWQRYRAAFLKDHPVCIECAKHAVSTPATVVDHRIPHKGNQTLFWDPGNHQPLCEHHHNLKTATQDGGFGHAARPQA